MTKTNWQPIKKSPSYIGGVGFSHVKFNLNWGKAYLNKGFIEKFKFTNTPEYLLVYTNQEKNKLKFEFTDLDSEDSYSLQEEGGLYFSAKKIAKLMKNQLNLKQEAVRFELTDINYEEREFYLDIKDSKIIKDDGSNGC